MENQLHVDHKNTHFNRKTNAALILPSNDFQDSERERERERAQVAAQPSYGSPDRVAPTAQITPPHHRDRAGQASSFFSLLP